MATSRRLLLAALAWTLSLAAAQAHTIVAETDSSRGRNLWLVENGVPLSQRNFTGLLTVTLTSDTGETETRDAICVDMFTSITTGTPYDSTVLSPTDVAGRNLPRIAWLINNALLPTYPTPGFTSELSSTYWADDTYTGAALQLAVWDIVHDNGNGFAAGAVGYGSTAHPANATVLAAAQYYLAASLGKSSTLGYVYRNFERGTTTEAQMLAGPLYMEMETPEPASLALVGAALIGLGFLRRRKTVTRR